MSRNNGPHCPLTPEPTPGIGDTSNDRNRRSSKPRDRDILGMLELDRPPWCWSSEVGGVLRFGLPRHTCHLSSEVKSRRAYLRTIVLMGFPRMVR